MAVSNANFELTTGMEASCVIGSTAFSRAVPKVKVYSQPDWYDDAAITNRVQKIGFKTGTLAAAATVTIDLQALDSPDGGSGTVSLSTLVACYITITSTTGKLTIGNGGANANVLDFGAAAHTRTILPGGPGHAVGDPVGTTGYPVDATHSDIKLLNSHGSASVDYIAYFAGR
jgi:hypothetical protein